VWYIDATGSVLKRLKKQSMPFLYSIVSHDPSTKTIIPIAEFVSCSHGALAISNYLFHIKSLFSQNIKMKNKFIFAPIIVTDFSWALINSIHQAFCCELFELDL
jgi:hypothetical protein